MKLDAITFHSANLNDEDESIVKIESPDRAPTPRKIMTKRSSHQGIPLFLMEKDSSMPAQCSIYLSIMQSTIELSSQ